MTKYIETIGLEKYFEFKGKSPYITKDDRLVFIDMTEPSSIERLYLYDIQNGMIVDSFFVAHGIESSSETEPTKAVSFSNSSKGRKTSIGAMYTGGVFKSKYGMALKLFGLELGVNDNVYARGIIIHGAPYVSSKYVREHGGCGCSFGSFAVGMDVCDVLINEIKDGVFTYVFSGE